MRLTRINSTQHENQARATFHDFDEDEDGRLSTSELARLCHQMGSKLTHNELQVCVFGRFDVLKGLFFGLEENQGFKSNLFLHTFLGGRAVCRRPSRRST